MRRPGAAGAFLLRPRPPLSRRAALAGLSCALLPAGVLAQPAQGVQASVAAQAVSTHRFRTFRFASADGHRRYRVDVAVPRAAPPAGGFPSLALCDGNAAFMSLTPADVESVPGLVLVALGYDAEVRYDLVARNYDYTPPVNGPGTVDEVRPEYRAGGADIFAAFVVDTVLARIGAEVPLDPARRGLQGHSYGGLFTLATLFDHPDLFRVYVAVSPSLWWYQGRALDHAPVKPAGRREVMLMIGDAEVNRRVIDGRRMPTPQEAVAALLGLGDRLRSSLDYRVQSRVFKGLGHGEMFEAALAPALHFAAERL